MANIIQRWFFNKNLPKVARKPNIGDVNPQKNIGILFDGSKEEDRKVVHAFKKQLKLSGAVQVQSLVFIDNKLPLDNVDYTAYNIKDINWYGVPKGPKVEKFINGPWDVVLFLGDKMELHYEYILSCVSTSFLIGTSVPHHGELFDLTVDTFHQTSLSQKINTIIKSIDLISIKKN